MSCTECTEVPGSLIFTEQVKTTNLLCDFSPCGEYLATAHQNNLSVRETRSQKVIAVFKCLDVVERVAWSCDSEFIFCAMYRRSVIQIWSVLDLEWRGKIDEGAAGLTDACWSPDGRHVLTTANFHLRITVWSLVNKSTSHIKYPKSGNPGLAFSPDGEYLALAERRDCKDFLSIFVCSSWQLVKHFECDTQDLSGISWSPDSSKLCVWESPLSYSVMIYSLDGNVLGKYSAYERRLGIKSVVWSPNGQFLAIGSYDQKLRLLNCLTWKPIKVFDHPSNVDFANCCVYREVQETLQGFTADLALAEGVSDIANVSYNIEETRPVSVPNVVPSPKKANPKLGVGTVKFSTNSRYFTTVNDNMPNTVWIWEVGTLCLKSLLIHSTTVKMVCWHPFHTKLAICTGGNCVYFWTPGGSMCASLPPDTHNRLTKLRWNPQGDVLLLAGKEGTLLCFQQGGGMNSSVINDNNDE